MYPRTSTADSNLTYVIIAVTKVFEHILHHAKRSLSSSQMISHQLEASLCRLVPCNYITERTKYILIVSGEA